MLTKSSLLYLFIIVLLIAGCGERDKKQSSINGDGLQVASLKGAGIDSIAISKIDTAITNGTYPNIHSLLIARDSKLVYEKYWAGTDESWGDDLGMTTHARDSLHDIRSISKSIVSACVGIAIEQGKIKSVDEKVMSFFPEYANLDTGWKSLLTVKHLLSMSSGIAWNEDVPYTNPENSEIRMIRSGNPVSFVLTQPMDFPPGKVWKYNGGTTQLLAAIIEKTTGKKVDRFAKEFLFTPLGIDRFDWAKYPGTDWPAAASGLRLRSRDLLKFGLLYNNKGMWNGKQVVPGIWVEESVQPQVQRPNGGSYGYQFWLWQDTLLNKLTSIVACVGNGDQRIFIDQSRNLVMVVTAGNYNKWDIKKNAGALIADYVYPALHKN